MLKEFNLNTSLFKLRNFLKSENKMTTINTDKLNIGFLFLSLIIAIILPFELFLFSYAILGPMHYLTEINWLKSKTYFSKTAKPAYILIGIVTLISLIYLSNFFNVGWFGFDISRYVKITVSILILSSFVFVILLEFFENKFGIWACLGLSVFIALLLLKLHSSFHIFSLVFLPTLVHVYFFTGLFMLYGYLRQKKTLGLFAVALLIIIPFLIYVMPDEFFQQIKFSSAEDTYNNGGFAQLNALLSKPFNTNVNPILNIKIQSFIAFAYTYHYLNWFGKTNVIGWARTINKRNLILILSIWLAIVGIYVYDYTLGLLLLFFMSLAHVLLEFPLNIKSFKGIFNFIK